MSNQKILTIDQSWELLFETHDILHKVQTHGTYHISSQDINKVKEARLMAKFDQISQLPKIFKDNRLSIVPIGRGEYIIGNFATHMPISYADVKPKIIEAPELVTLDHTNLYSESSALLFAYNSGIMADVMNTNQIFYTVNGRMSSGTFSYQINDSIHLSKSHNIEVNNSQIEIDAGYESKDAFCICEAKNIAVNDLLIRQLYYPYRLWKTKIDKPILPVFFVHSNDIFHTFLYEVTDINHYNSMKLVSHNAYAFTNNLIAFSDIVELHSQTKPKKEPSTVFPQANSFARIVDLLSVLYESDLTRDEITLNYEFDERQTQYYLNAGEYLGLVERTPKRNGIQTFYLTAVGTSIMKLPYKEKYLALIKKIFEQPVFHEAFALSLVDRKVPSSTSIEAIMAKHQLTMGSSTIARRASTARSWIDWIYTQSI